MRLLKIGRDASCDIVLHSDKVSSLHAEMTVLNNGDILLEDKNSRNGTFLMNKPIKPGSSVSVRRGDAIRFGDVELMWNQIPMTENNSNFKAMFGIGSNFRNEIQISGNTVSRFHATLKIGKYGKAYIQDHSKNGTTVNGTKITFGQNVRIKRNDAIVCGGVPVNLKQFMPPKPWTKIVGIVAVAAILAGAIWGVKYIVDNNNGKPKDYIESVTYVHGYYHFNVKIANDPFIKVMKDLGITGYPEEFSLGRSNNGSFGILDGKNYFSIGYSGTAFFISGDGKMMTNRHVACPWTEITPDEKAEIYTEIRKLKDKWLPVNSLLTSAEVETFNNSDFMLKPFLLAVYKKKRDFNLISALIAEYKRADNVITGVHDYIAVGYANHNYSSIDEFERCTVLSETENDKIDLAILQLNNRLTPPTIKKYIDLSKSIVDEKSLVPLENNYYYIGYPMGTSLNLRNEDGGLTPLLNEVKISRTPGKYEFDLQGEVFGGASGSPILDKKGHLVGVVNKSIRYTTMSMGVLAKHAKELLDKTENK